MLTINFKKNLILNQNGFSMMEMIVVLSIFTIGLLGVASLMLQTMQAEAVNAGYLKASMFAQEGLELVRGYRDDNWLDQTATNWDDNFGDTDGEFIVDHRLGSINDNPDFISESATFLRLNGDFYEHGVGVLTNFRRLITVTNCGVDCRGIESRVEWKASGKEHSYVAETILYNWR